MYDNNRSFVNNTERNGTTLYSDILWAEGLVGVVSTELWNFKNNKTYLDVCAWSCQVLWLWFT